MSIYANLFGGDDPEPPTGKEEKKVRHIKNYAADLKKVYRSKTENRRKKRTEFPPEQKQEDPLEEEAQLYIKNILEGRKPSETIEYNVDPEIYYGNVEYKLTLFGRDRERLKHLTTQLNFRLNEGKGQAIYKVGIEDNGNPLGITDEHLFGSLVSLYKISHALKTEMILDKLYYGQKGKWAEVIIQRRLLEKQKIDIRIVLLGGFNVGKSTLLGVLVGGEKDNGEGSARNNVARHQHEIIEGFTSSVNEQLIGFDSKGNIINRSAFGVLEWPEILEQSIKCIRFIDVSGQEKYSKTVLQGVCSQYPDFAIILISAVEGITETTLQHFHVAFTLKLPFIVVVTKIDLVEEERLYAVRDKIKKLLRKDPFHQIGIVIKNFEDVALLTKNLEERITLINMISTKTGKGLDLFTGLLNSLPQNTSWKSLANDSPIFHVTGVEEVEGSPVVLWGVAYRGTIKRKQEMQIGPDLMGVYRIVRIESIMCMREDVKSVHAGQICSLQLLPSKSAEDWLKKKGRIRKGMVLLDSNKEATCTRTFICEIWTIDGSNKLISSTFQPVINCHNIRQAATMKVLGSTGPHESPTLKSTTRIVMDNPDEDTKELPKLGGKMKSIRSMQDIQAAQIETPDKEVEKSPKKIEISAKRTRVQFKFLYHPEYMETGSTMVILSPTLNAFGEIIEIFNDV